jgi:N-acetylmuramoyl-L-alanine amidase
MTVEVINHWLDWASPEVSLTKKTERVSSVIVPELIVVHYAVTHSLDATTAAQRARGYWAQISIDGYASIGPDYRVYQSMPLNMYGSHAGDSVWTRPTDGVRKSGCNAFSIGVEIANPGPLIEREGKLYTVYGKEWDRDDAVEIRHRNPTPKEWTHWARYSDQEIDILIALGHALRKAYPTIVDMRGHDEISPGRKSDPGPAMDMDYLRGKVFG